MKKLLSAGTKIRIATPETNAETLAADITAVEGDFVEIQCALTGLSTEATEREQIETTSLCDTYAKSYMDGLKDADTATSDAFFNLKSVEGIAMQEAVDSDPSVKSILQVEFTDGSTWTSYGRVQPFGFNIAVGDVVKTTFNFKLSGEPEISVA